jgi:low temperature requirement protein LtrA
MKAPLRRRDGEGGRVSNAELFFDLVYAFAVTQVSHTLLHNLTPVGALQSLVLWFAVWLGWQYTSWMTNWFDPDGLRVRAVLFGIMVVALVMSAALPQAFGAGGWVFAGCYATIQIGRGLCVLLLLGDDHALRPNYQRIFGWACISASFWLVGSLLPPAPRLAFWIIAVGCEYVSPMVGFWLPKLGKSRTSDWTIDGGHLAERCQAFVMVALGESIVATGGTLAESDDPGTAVLFAFLIAFVASLSMWWMYFDTSSEAATNAIRHSDDPGRIGAFFHYVHVVIVGGVIVVAVGADLSIAHPDAAMSTASAWVLIGGPAAYVFANGLFKTVVYGRFPLSHVVGLALFAAIAFLAFHAAHATASCLAALALAVVALWEARARAGRREIET